MADDWDELEKPLTLTVKTNAGKLSGDTCWNNMGTTDYKDPSRRP